ncbi:MAG: radical SAM protein [Flavobacteriales bacterium]|nr:radical SAM protein [Flavobacteriales bacterium]
MNFNPFKRSKKYDLSKASSEFTKEILEEYDNSRPNGPQEKLCLAPFKSMYFSYSGSMNVCCYSRTYILGQYPMQSIKETWLGKRADALREYITQNNLDHGCEGCKMHILSGGYDVTKAKQYDEMTLNDNGYPSVMEFELDNTCNLECEMCSGNFSSLIRKNREGRPPLENPYDAEFVRQLEEFIPHLQEVKFYGGEPFLIKIYYDIWEKIIELNPSIRISVQTNGTILNNRVKRIMEKSEFHIGISIDSLQKASYESIRKNATFERTMENLEWFKDYCKQRGTFFGLAACAMPQNWKELPDFVRHCNEFEIPIYFNTVFFPPERSFPSLGAEELLHIIEALSLEKFPRNTPIEIKNKNHFEDQIKQLKHLLKEKLTEIPRLSKLESMDDLKQFVGICINEQPVWSEDDKNHKRTAIFANLDELEIRLGEHFDYASVFNRWNMAGQSSVFIHNMLSEFETGPIDHLVVRINGTLLPEVG